MKRREAIDGRHRVERLAGQESKCLAMDPLGVFAGQIPYVFRMHGALPRTVYSDAVLTEANLTDQSAACQVSWFGFATIRSTP